MSKQQAHTSTWLESLAKLILVLNLLDAVFTLIWLRFGLAREANIFLSHTVEHHPVLFVAVKFSLVSLGVYLLWRYRQRWLAGAGLVLVGLVYYLILLYHLQFLSRLLVFLYLAP